MIVKAWNRYWFSETPYSRLALFRILVLLLALIKVVGYWPASILDARGRGELQLSREWQPLVILEAFGVNPPDVATLTTVFIILIVAIVFGIVGLFTRISCAIAAVLFLYWIGVGYSFGQAHHSMVALAFALISFPLSPCGERLSIDALISRLKRIRAGHDPFLIPKTGQFAGWPLHLIQISISIAYCAAGLSKLIIVGPIWMNGYTVQGTMLNADGPLSYLLAQSVVLCSVMSAITVAFEVFFPIVLFWPLSRWLVLPVMFSFHLLSWGTGIIGNSYIGLWYMLICFVPLEKFGSWMLAVINTGSLFRRVTCTAVTMVFIAGVLFLYCIETPSALYIFFFFPAYAAYLAIRPSYRTDLIYDGSSDLCKKTVGIISALDWSQRIRFFDTTQWDKVLEIHPDLKREGCMSHLHAIDTSGNITCGYEAYRLLAWRLPLVAPLAPIFYLPFIASLGNRVYANAVIKKKNK